MTLICITEIQLVDLLDLLTYNKNSLDSDLFECCNFGDIMSEEDRDHASRAAHSQQLRSFLVKSGSSSALLIHGNRDDPVPMSSLRFLVGKLCLTFANTEEIVVLCHFCGLHADILDPKANASGMMTNIIGQLLSIADFKFDLSSIHDETWQHIENDDCETLCRLFLFLIPQISRTKVVFCFIDSISIYETEERKENTNLVLSTLTNLASSQNDGPEFKLLITDSGRSEYAGLYITEDENVVEMNNSFDDDGHGVSDLEASFG